jgi:ATP-binding cassette subfamily B (MDR/TAP) protein 1
LFAETIELLFRRVSKCDPENLSDGFNSCQEFWDSVADAMQQRSFELAGFWVIVALVSVFGNMLTFWGFGQASERMSKRVRDAAFSSLLRQEVAFFDQRSVGKITSELQEDAARVQTFSKYRGLEVFPVIIILCPLPCSVLARPTSCSTLTETQAGPQD